MAVGLGLAMDHLVLGEPHCRETHLAETDESLAARAASDPAALAELYHRHLPGIYHYCRYRLRDLNLAEDVTGQIFLHMVEGLRKKPIHRFRPWLYTVAHHEVVSAYRRNRNHLDLDVMHNRVSPERGPEEIAISQSLVSDVLGYLPKLPPNERAVIELRLVGLPNLEICQVLGKSHAWVRTTQHRAITHMRALANGEESAR